MLSKTDIKKNVLDLRYQQQLQTYNALLIFVSTGILAFIGGAIATPQYLSAIALASGIVVSAGLIYYLKVMKPTMENILGQLVAIGENLKS